MEPKICPDCGGSLPPGALDGACPRCLLAAGLVDDGDGGDGNAAVADPDAPAGDAEPTPHERPAPPTVEEIAPHFPALVVEELIGAGGMGIVYRAHQTALDRRVALKVLWPELAADKSFAERFTREARAMARLDHPNIVHVYEFGEHDGFCFLVMEFVDGKNLRELMDEGGIHPAEALAIVPQICAALQYAHDQGVVHRDIKPANVLVDRTGRVRIADFGLAKLVEGDDVTLTRAGQVMGTLHYMAPEQYKTPDDVDHRADIYSLGVVFYEMLTGDVPVGRFEAPSERVHVDVRLDQVVLRSLEREPERRYQQASDVGTAVSSISSGEAPRPVPPVAAVPLPVDGPVAEKPPARLSKLAVASLVMVGVQAVLALVALAAPPVIVLSMGAALLALLLGFVGWVRVLGSGGRLRGAMYAFSAMIAPWFVGCGGLLLLGSVAAQHGIDGMHPIRIDQDGTVTFGDFVVDHRGVRIGDWVQIDDDGVRVSEPIEIDDRGVRRLRDETAPVPSERFTENGLDVTVIGGPHEAGDQRRMDVAAGVAATWRDLQAVIRDAAAYDLSDLMRLYGRRGRELVGRLPEEEREKARAGAYGAPLLRAPFVTGLGEYEVDAVELNGPGDRAWVTARRDGDFVRFRMVSERGIWLFDTVPVEYGHDPFPSERR